MVTTPRNLSLLCYHGYMLPWLHVTMLPWLHVTMVTTPRNLSLLCYVTLPWLHVTMVTCYHGYHGNPGYSHSITGNRAVYKTLILLISQGRAGFGRVYLLALQDLKEVGHHGITT